MTSNDNIYIGEDISVNMANTLISVRMSDDLLRDINLFIKPQGYSNAQEFLRAAVREKIQKEKTALAILELEKLYGSARGKKIHFASKKELDALAYKKGKSSQLFRKFGLE